MAIKPTLVDGKMHLLYWHNANKVMYLQYDFTNTLHTTIVIEQEIAKYAYGFFGNVNRSFVEPNLSNTIYEAFIGASMNSFTK